MCSSEFKDRGVLRINTVGVKLVLEIRFIVVGSTVELIVKEPLHKRWVICYN